MARISQLWLAQRAPHTGRASAPRTLRTPACRRALQKRFMSRLGADSKLGLMAQRVGHAAAALTAQEAVPWSSRDPATQAAAMIYGVLAIHKVAAPPLRLRCRRARVFLRVCLRADAARSCTACVVRLGDAAVFKTQHSNTTTQ